MYPSSYQDPFDIATRRATRQIFVVFLINKRIKALWDTRTMDTLRQPYIGYGGSGQKMRKGQSRKHRGARAAYVLICTMMSEIWRPKSAERLVKNQAKNNTPSGSMFRWLHGADS